MMKVTGTLFISKRVVAFFSKLFGTKIKEVIPGGLIESLSKKEKDPNTFFIVVSNTHKKYTITLKSVESCNSAFQYVEGIKNLCSDKPAEEVSSKISEDLDSSSTLTQEDWAVLLNSSAGKSYLLSFTKGDTIIHEGMRHNMICQISKGKCNIEKVLPGDEKPTIISTIREGEIIGEVTFLRETVASASVVAKKNCEVYMIDGQYVKSLAGSHPALVARLYHYICTVLSARIQKLEKGGH